MSLLGDIWSVLTARQRRWVVAAQFLSLLMAFSTVAGIASIAPFFSVLGNPALIHRTPQLQWLYQLRFSNTRSFTAALGLAFMALVVLANAINIAGSFVMIRLAMWIGTDLQSILFSEYLHRPYVFHARTHSSLLFNNLMHETTRSTNHLLQNAFSLNTNIVTAFFIVASVMLLNPMLATAMLTALAGGYVLIYLAVRNRLLRAGEIESRFFIEQTKIVNESLGAIRDILLRRLQPFFCADFERSSGAFARAAAHTQLIGQSPRYVMECVAAVGLVTVTLLIDRRDGGIGLWLGQLTFLGFAAYRLLPSLQQAFMALVKIRADRTGFASIAPDLRLARSRTGPAAAGSARADAAWAECPQSTVELKDVLILLRAGPPAGTRRDFAADRRAHRRRPRGPQRFGKNHAGRAARGPARARRRTFWKLTARQSMAPTAAHGSRVSPTCHRTSSCWTPALRKTSPSAFHPPPSIGRGSSPPLTWRNSTRSSTSCRMDSNTRWESAVPG